MDPDAGKPENKLEVAEPRHQPATTGEEESGRENVELQPLPEHSEHLTSLVETSAQSIALNVEDMDTETTPSGEVLPANVNVDVDKPSEVLTEEVTETVPFVVQTKDDAASMDVDESNVVENPVDKTEIPIDEPEKSSQFSSEELNKNIEIEIKLHLENAIVELENSKLQILELKKLNANSECFRKQRDSAVEERNGLLDIITQLNKKMQRMEDTYSQSSMRLKNTINSNCEMIAKNGELQTKELSLRYKEESLDQDRSILNERIYDLTKALNKAHLDMETAQITYASKISNLEIQLATKTQELDISDEYSLYLKSERIKLNGEIGNLEKNLVSKREAHDKVCHELQKKLHAKTKSIELYKSMRDDSNLKCEELEHGAAELQKLLTESLEKYGTLGLKNMQNELQYESTIHQKNNEISSLKKELEGLKNECSKFKADSVNLELSHMSPTTFVTKEFLKSGKSLVEIYSELVSVSEELAKKTDENKRVKKELNDLMNELQESAPYIERCKSQYDEIVNDHSVISHQLESVEAEYKQLREDYAEAVKLTSLHDRENKRLRCQMNDLNQQVCFLLKELDINRGTGHNGSSLHNNIDDSRATSSSLISNNLVTFGDIQQLQFNNQKLLKIVRELTEKQEETESFKEQIESGELQKKLEILTEKVSDLQSSNECQSRQLKSAIKQRDMYKKLYHDKANVELSVNDSVEKMDESEINENYENKPDVKLLESQLEDAKKQIFQHNEDHKKLEEHYESKTKMLLAQIDKLRKDWNDLNQKYKVCFCDLKKNLEHGRLLQGELVAQRGKVTDLQNKSEKSLSKISEYESSMKFLREAGSRSEKKLAQTEIMLKNVENECTSLQVSNTALLIEKDRLNEELQDQNLLLNNLQIIKDMFENKHSSNKSSFESKLDNFSRECLMLQSKLEEKTSLLKSRPNNLNDVDEEVISLRKELEEKTKILEELQSPSNGEPYESLAQKVNEMEGVLKDRVLQIDISHQQVDYHKNREKELISMFESAEQKLKKLNDEYALHKYSKESELSTLQNLVEELNEKCKELETELSLYNNSQYEITKNLKSELSQAQETIDALSKELQTKISNLDEANIKILELTDDLLLIQENNLEKDQLFNQNVQIIASLKKDVEELRNEMMDVRDSSDRAEKDLAQHKIDWEKCKDKLEREKNEIVSQLDDSNQHNSLLLDQLELFNSQNVMSQRQMETLNESSLNDSSLNASSSENDLKSISKLTQIINYIRKERDVQCTKFNAMQEENLRIKCELKISEKTINDMKNKNSDNASSASLMKHVDVIKKLETLNTISHNNTLLREERDNLLVRVNELSSTLNKVEESLSAVEQNNGDLLKKINNLVTENSNVRAECIRWKNRFNSLSEKANKTNPEDWKRLQSERETLAKMLTGEKENLKKVRDEMLINKLEKTKFEEQNSQLNKKHQTLNEEIKKHINDNNNLRKELTQMSSELNSVKVAIIEKTDEITKINQQLADQTIELGSCRDKEVMLRRAANKFRVERDEFSALLDEKIKAEQQRSEQSSNIDNEQRFAEIEKIYGEKISELTTNTTKLSDENDSLQLEIANLKTKSKEIEDKAKAKLIEARDKIISMNEANESFKNKLEEANTENIKLLALKSKLEKEKDKAASVQQEEVSQLNKQIETLSQKVNVMQKQIDIQPVKTSISSNQGDKPTVEPPTANIKPMSGSQQPIGSRRTTGETPLASIKPMTSGVRTAAVLPNAQYSTATSMHHHSLHTSVNTPVETVSSLPSSSHMEHLSSSSFRHPVSPYSMSTSDTDIDPIEKGEASNANIVTLPQTGIPQTVALVNPRMEAATIDSSIVNPQPTLTSNTLISTVSTSYGNPNPGSEQATDQVRQKRPRTEVEQEKMESKKQKIELVDTTECEIEYQLPSSSQHQEEDQENGQEDDEKIDEGDEEEDDEGDEQGDDQVDDQGDDQEDEQEEEQEDEQEEDQEDEEDDQDQFLERAPEQHRPTKRAVQRPQRFSSRTATEQDDEGNNQDDDPVIVLESDEEEEDKEKRGTDEESVESEGEEEEVVEEEDVSPDDESDEEEEHDGLEIDEAAAEEIDDANEQSPQGDKYVNDDNDYQADDYMRIDEGNAAAAALQGYDDQNEEDPES